MKKMAFAVLVFLLLALTFPSIPKVSATTEDLWVTPGLPEDVPSEPMPENYTTENYLNTTNPYSQINPLGEETDEEGSHPLYVLVFGDEEARNTIYVDPTKDYPASMVPWDEYTRLQLERGDEALVSNFGIDIRILGFLEWDSDDSLDTMEDLWYELESDTENYLGQYYSGDWWSDYVDVIIGITAQETPGDLTAGLAPGTEYLDQGRIFVLVKWQVYWMDDNLVQHEVSHLFYADDHVPTCCAMASHTYYQTVIWEDALWLVFNDVHCSHTAYSWCTNCHQIIQQNSGKYLSYTLTISSSSGGYTDPMSGTYTCDYGSSVTVTATGSSYDFSYWWLDNNIVYDNPITVTMDSDHILEAYFEYTGGGGGGADPVCPTLFVWDGTAYAEEGILDIHAYSDVTIHHEIENTLALDKGVYKLQLRELDNHTSHIDQVKLYAVDYEGEWHLCPLIYACHSELGKVKHTIRFDDENRVDLEPTEMIDLQFALSTPYGETAYFIFEINGYNRKGPTMK